MSIRYILCVALAHAAFAESQSQDNFLGTRASTGTDRQQGNTSLTTQSTEGAALGEFNNTNIDINGHDPHGSAFFEPASHASSRWSGTDSSGSVLLESAIWHHVCNACSWVFGSCSNVGCQHVDWHNYEACRNGQYMGRFGGTLASIKDRCAEKCLDYIQNYGSTGGCCDLALYYDGNSGREQGICKVAAAGYPVQQAGYAKQYAARISTR